MTCAEEEGALRSLEVAGRLFYWRPALALQRAYLLEAYARTLPGLEPPLVDLGCGEGLFAKALKERGVVDGVDVGLDYLMEDLRAHVSPPRLGLVQADLRRLPFADGSLGAAFSNCVLSSFVGAGTSGLVAALAEIRRVLRPGGRFAACVATPAYAGNATSHRLASALGGEGLARRVEAWIDRRNDHTVVLGPRDWQRLLREAGLAVEGCRPVVGRRYADRHRWLAFAKGADLPRKLGLRRLTAAQGAAQAALFRAVLGRGFAAAARCVADSDPTEAGFVLLVARKD